MKKVLPIALLLSLAGCSSTLTTPPAGQGLLAGVNNSEKKVMIRSIDNGELLWVGNYKLGTSAAIDPGKHSVSIMCEFTYSWGTKLLPGHLDIDVTPGVTYKIDGVESSDDGTCDLTVST